ncbi:MAG: UbiA family prenyltransferase [Bacteroidetes bacterium]|nr:UbiA family prenyltransferase [Bacteroidota bacterium]
MKKIKGLFRLIRFELPFSAGVCVVMGQLLALGKFAPVIEIAAGFLSIFSISASILVLNDYFDVETDRINAPHRPIPSNVVTPSEALILSIVLLSAGLILSYLISAIAFISALVLLIIGFLYNRKFKKSGLPGNLMVSFSVGMTFVFGGISVGLPFSKAALFFGVIGALVDLGEEIAADSMDMEGDKLIKSNSLAIKYGKETALKISGYIFSFVILLSLIPFLLGWFSMVYLIPIGIMDFAIGYSALKLVNSKGEEGRKHIRWIYLGATFGLLIFLFMRVLGV